MDRSPAQVALNWVARRPGVATTLIGARTMEQLEDNLAALEFELSAEQVDRLDSASRPDPVLSCLMFGTQVQEQFLTPGFRVRRRPEWVRG